MTCTWMGHALGDMLNKINVMQGIQRPAMCKVAALVLGKYITTEVMHSVSSLLSFEFIKKESSTLC